MHHFTTDHFIAIIIHTSDENHELQSDRIEFTKLPTDPTWTSEEVHSIINMTLPGKDIQGIMYFTPETITALDAAFPTQASQDN